MVSINCDDPKIQKIIHEYYGDEARGDKIKNIVDHIVRKFFGSVIYQKDMDDFYSIANELFVEALAQWDGKRDFRGLFYSMVQVKCYSRITALNADKRTMDREAEYFSTPVDGESGTILQDFVEGQFDIDEEAGLDSERVRKFLKKISSKERKIVILLMKGYKPAEVRKILGLDMSTYNNRMLSIRLSRNTDILYRND